MVFDAFVEWVTSIVGPGYLYSRGMWVDSPAVHGDFIASIQKMGGPEPDVEDRRPRFKVILLGPRDGRKHAISVEQTMESLAQAALGDSSPCGAASVRAVGEAVGPGYTSENRPWYSLDFEVLL
ncbi:phage tail termination protein [Achromobacter xylosoxidans]|uniref:phage tail termination protein n=1 Tax=Alcaligenes xylosoxydans xylosoxydans TaxID=85698 RepID=UPI0038FC4C6A